MRLLIFQHIVSYFVDKNIFVYEKTSDLNCFGVFV